MRAVLFLLLATAASAQAPADTAVVDLADVRPEIVGGMAALGSAIVYPASALAAEVEGTVVLQFVVGTDGGVSQAEAVRSPDAALSQAALDALRAQRFTPGQVGSEPARVRMTLPIRFRLPEPAPLAALPAGVRTRPAPVDSTSAVRGPDQDGLYELDCDQPEAGCTEPELIGRISPDYPERARRGGIQGEVIIQFTVDEAGTPVDLEVKSSPHELLSEASLREVRRLRFVPATVDGRPVKVRFSVPMNFRLR